MTPSTTRVSVRPKETIDPPYGEAPVPPESQHLVVGDQAVTAQLHEDHPLHPDNNDHKTFFKAFYEWAQDIVAELGGGAMHERLQNLHAHGRVLLGAAKDMYQDLKPKPQESGSEKGSSRLSFIFGLLVLSLLALVLAPFAHSQTASVFPIQNNAAASSAGPGGAVTNPSGNNIAISPGPILCGGTVSYIQSSQFTMVGQQAIPAVASASGQSQTFYIFYRCGGEQLMVTIESPRPPADVPIASVLQSNSAGSLSYTITDLRSAGSFPNQSDYIIPFGPGDCGWNATGTLTGTNGLTVTGASFTPTNQAQTSNAGATNDTLTCHIPVPQRTTASKGVQLSDCVIYYGVQTTALTSLGAPTLSTISMPTPGAGETASTVTPVSIGAVTVTPVVGSANLGTTTAGAFFDEKVALNTPTFLNTDVQWIGFQQLFAQSAAAAQIVQTPGGVCHATIVPL